MELELELIEHSPAHIRIHDGKPYWETPQHTKDPNYTSQIHVDEIFWTSPSEVAEETLREIYGDDEVDWLMRHGCFNEAEGYETSDPFRTEDNCHFCGEHDAQYFNISKTQTIEEKRRVCTNCRLRKFGRQFVKDTHGDERSDSFGRNWVQHEFSREPAPDHGWAPEIRKLKRKASKKRLVLIRRRR